APQAKIMSIRNGVIGVTFNLTSAMKYAIQHHVGVIAISQSGAGSDELRQSVEDALHADIVVVAGVGNQPNGGVGFPAAYPGVLAVGGVDSQGRLYSKSAVGPEVVVVAPSVDIVSTNSRLTNTGEYSISSGTSDATAIVAGVVALVRSRFPAMSASQVIRQ